MEYKELMEVLPHREPMLLLDRAELKDGMAWGEKTITGREWFLQGHFPGCPVVPGVILCEILAQSACVLPEIRAMSDHTLITSDLNNATKAAVNSEASIIFVESAQTLTKDAPAQSSLPRQTYLTGLESVRFRTPVRPGDCFKTQCQIICARPPFFWAKGKGFVRDSLCLTAEFSFAVR